MHRLSLVFSLLLWSCSSSPDGPGACGSNQDCQSGEICAGGVCQTLCASDRDCAAGSICINSVCEVGVRANMPAITSVDGDDPNICADTPGAHCALAGLLIVGENLGGVAFELVPDGGPSQILTTRPGATDTNAAVDLPDVAPGDYVLRASNSAGESNQPLTLLQGVAGPSGPSGPPGPQGTPGDSLVAADNDAALAPGASLTVAHGFGSNDVSVSIWASLDGGSTYDLTESVVAPVADVGDGSDGPITVNSTTIVNAYATAAGPAGQTALVLGSSAGFANGDVVLLMQVQGTEAGAWEENQIVGLAGVNATLARPLAHSYSTQSGSVAQAVTVPQYTNVTVQAGGAINAAPWDGATGGVVAFKATGTVTVEVGGQINATGNGFRGGVAGVSPRDRGIMIPSCGAPTAEVPPFPGESIVAAPSDPLALITASCNTSFPNVGGGGSGLAGNGEGMSGGSGGSHLGSGKVGTSACTSCGSSQRYQTPPYTSAGSERLFFGSGGGGGSAGYIGANTPPGEPNSSGDAGDGGGLIMITASVLNNGGRIHANGARGLPGAAMTPSDTNNISGGGGGGGAGGTIWIRADGLSAGETAVSGGPGGNGSPTLYSNWASSPHGGAGGDGVLRLERLSPPGFAVIQDDTNTVRLVNRTGRTQNVRVIVRR